LKNKVWEIFEKDEIVRNFGQRSFRGPVGLRLPASVAHLMCEKFYKSKKCEEFLKKMKAWEFWKARWENFLKCKNTVNSLVYASPNYTSLMKLSHLCENFPVHWKRKPSKCRSHLCEPYETLSFMRNFSGPFDRIYGRVDCKGISNKRKMLSFAKCKNMKIFKNEINFAKDKN
jgi:hypothetical protein